MGGSDASRLGFESVILTCDDVRSFSFNFSEWFRLFVGDLSNDVSDDVLANAFNKYTSFTKARVIRDRLSGKVSFLSLHSQPLSNIQSGSLWIRGILKSRGLP